MHSSLVKQIMPWNARIQQKAGLGQLSNKAENNQTM